MKVYQCEGCRSNFLYESDWVEHTKHNAAHETCNVYDLDEFLTRFLVAA